MTREPRAQCVDCKLRVIPNNPEEPEPRRWRMPPGWVLLPRADGRWSRRCGGCDQRARERRRRRACSPERMPSILETLRRFWEQYPDRQLGEVLALAMRLRRVALTDISDADLAALLRFWTLTESDRELEEREGLLAIDPWSALDAAPAERAAGRGVS